MGTNVVFLGWDRPTAGREGKAVELFQEYMQYLGGLQQAGTIQSFEPVFLECSRWRLERVYRDPGRLGQTRRPVV